MRMIIYNNSYKPETDHHIWNGHSTAFHPSGKIKCEQNRIGNLLSVLNLNWDCWYALVHITLICDDVVQALIIHHTLDPKTVYGINKLKVVIICCMLIFSKHL